MIRRPSFERITAAYERAVGEQVTYADVGAAMVTMPDRFRHDHMSVHLGSGRKVFQACSEFLDSWGLQRAMGFAVYPLESRAITETTVVLQLRMLGLWFLVPCRVVYEVDEQTRHGFAYGTLPGHPECGEQYFGVIIDSEERVFFEMRAFSKPSSLLTKAGGPIARHLQKRAWRDYGKVMIAEAERAVASSQ